ncbi:hypothetical protein F4808DRAFT_361717 [Astrocystis sublimbata]|nr:hypothetical protein F4808DRAFT_361717 [Astrocystis sublimbata]
MGLEIEPKNWYRDEFLISTDPRLIQVDEVSSAMDSDLMWWAQAPPTDVLRKALHNSLCLGLYELPQSTSQIAGKSGPRQIGLMRIITDDVTFAYLTDVYVLSEYQGKGLGRWMLTCLEDVMKGWPYLRRMMLACAPATLELYKKALGAENWDELHKGNLVLGTCNGPAAPSPTAHH